MWASRPRSCPGGLKIKWHFSPPADIYRWMQEPADTELLRQYAEHNSETAFAALVTRHVNLVYSAALRKTEDPYAAEEVTQAVFIILAKKARVMRRGTILSGWLYQAARLTAAGFLRREIRGVRREQEAYMQSLSNGGGDAPSYQTGCEVWPRIVPLLEDAMGRLNEKERNAIVLRFFEGKTFQEIGAVLDGSETRPRNGLAGRWKSCAGFSSSAAWIRRRRPSRRRFPPIPFKPRRWRWQKP